MKGCQTNERGHDSGIVQLQAPPEQATLAGNRQPSGPAGFRALILNRQTWGRLLDRSEGDGFQVEF